MPTPSLKGCREKHRRGVEHLKALDAELSEYVGGEPKPHHVRGEFERDRREYVFTGKIVRPMDDLLRWGVIFGDVMHNLRSALDHVVWQLVLLDTGKDGTRENQFPLASYGAQYWSGTKDRPSLRDRYLKGVSEDHRAVIDAFQPYRATKPPGATPALAALRDFSNRDKHCVIHPTLFAVDIAHDDDFRLIPNEDAGSVVGTTLRPFVEDGEAEIMAVEYTCPGPNPDVSVEGGLPIGIGFGEARTRLTDLPTLAQEVANLIDAFAPDFPS